MDGSIWLLLAIPVGLGLYMAWNIGANDVANSMAVAVGSRSITIRNAVIAAGICEFLGAVLVGSSVTDTIRKGIIKLPDAAESETVPDEQAAKPAGGATWSRLSVEAKQVAIGMTCSLLAAAVWLNLATWLGMPVSTTHSIVGAVIGFGLVAFGLGAISWWMVVKIVASWFISPVLGGLIAFLLFKLILRKILSRRQPAQAAVQFAPLIVFVVGFVMALSTVKKGLKHVIDPHSWLAGGEAAWLLSVVVGGLSFITAQLYLRRKLVGRDREPIGKQLEHVEKVFAPLVVITSCCVAFSHGANDVANSVGPLAAVVDIVKTGVIQEKVPVPFWVLSLGGVGIVVGLATYGYRVMHTVGTKITQLTPTRGIAADVATTIVVLACSQMGLPVSTTHTLVGAILGVGLARGLASVDGTVTRNIFGGWLITVPAAGAMTAILYWMAAWVLL